MGRVVWAQKVVGRVRVVGALERVVAVRVRVRVRVLVLVGAALAQVAEALVRVEVGQERVKVARVQAVVALAQVAQRHVLALERALARGLGQALA